MEEPGADRSSSPSGSEDSESESKAGDTVENGRESEEEQERDGHSKGEAEDSSSDSDGSGGDESEHSAKSEGGDGGTENHHAQAEEHSTGGGYPMEGVPYPLADLPLEVITTVEPTNFAYPVLKNMSNGVLTHRNIFTEAERSVLVGIINKYRNIVDTRSRTREIYLEKQNVWQQIVEEYNSTDNIMVRTEKELRKCWDNMKYRAKQAEKEMFKVEVKVEDETEPVIKMEPLEYDPIHYAREYEGGSEDPWQCGEPGGEEEKEPALKKARQESPKLSSLLLAAAHKRSPAKKAKNNIDTGNKNSSNNNNNNNNTNNNNNNSTSNNSSNNFPYSIPSCTKVMHVKKKGQSNIASGMSSQEIPILPKGLASCLSITNIPNPAGTQSNSSRESVSPSTSLVQSALKPMPSLKKMVPSKTQHSTSMAARPTKKSNGVSSKAKGYSVTPGPEQSSSPVPGDTEGEERLLSSRLVNQRLQMEQREHELRMRLLEKELQAHNFQCQYWSLRLKLLRSGRESSGSGPPNLAGATNGDID